MCPRPLQVEIPMIWLIFSHRVKRAWWHWPLTSPCMSMMQVIVLHPCTKFEFRRSPLRKMAHIFRLRINRPIAILTFGLSTSKGARVNRVMGFLPVNFQLPICPSTLDLGSGTGQTDRQTVRQTVDGHRCIRNFWRTISWMFYLPNACIIFHFVFVVCLHYLRIQI